MLSASNALSNETFLVLLRGSYLKFSTLSVLHWFALMFKFLFPAWKMCKNNELPTKYFTLSYIIPHINWSVI